MSCTIYKIYLGNLNRSQGVDKVNFLMKGLVFHLTFQLKDRNEKTTGKVN